MEALKRFAVGGHANDWDAQRNPFTKDLISVFFGESAHFVFAA